MEKEKYEHFKQYCFHENGNKILKKLSTDQPYFDNVSRNTTLFILGVM